ncbi:MAG: hypothetical protein LJE96_19420 [Deltaproteobacteria bacterium]|nr:hypothetical protein [Deltaproteobacteria bacterium]
MKKFFGAKGLFSRREKDLTVNGTSAGRRSFAMAFDAFQKILELNNQALEMMAALGDVLSGDYVFDRRYIETGCRELSDTVNRIIGNLNILAPKRYITLYDAFNRINHEIEEELSGKLVIPRSDYVMPYTMTSRDFEDVVGAKNANLAEVANAVGLFVPEGFAVSTRAFGAFMDRNHLWGKVSAVIAQWERAEMSLKSVSGQIRAMILAGNVPRDVRSEIAKAANRLERSGPIKNPFFAVRSSAVEEDGEHSFAGLHLSLLNVSRGDLLDAYKRVLASLYVPAAMEYRKDKGFLENEVVMAVGCQVMVDAVASGVLYTMDTLSPESERMVITSVRGLGAPVVSGEISGDRHLVDRNPPHAILSSQVAPQPFMLALKSGGGTHHIAVKEEKGCRGACLTEGQLHLLAEAGISIERHFKKPQDIEYAFDRKGTLYILQTRPLKFRKNRSFIARDLPSLLARYKVVFQNRGVVAQRGVGSGKAYLVKQNEDLEQFPSGAVLVAQHSSPRFAQVIRRASALLTDVGSPTGHLATIAREFRVPAIVGTQVATRRLTHGQEITVDAEDKKVYEGIVKELHVYHLGEEHIEESYEYRLLRRILKKIAPLNLFDPGARRFSPQGAKTLHDIVRFVHEKAVEELINLQSSHGYDPKSVSGKLKLSVPLDLVLIDIGEGLVPDRKSPAIEPEEITSVPMGAFVSGLSRSGAWNTDPADVDFGSFMSSLTRTFASGLSSPKNVGQNLAVISRNYANISLRLGYHFNMIDAYIGPNQNSNYAYFRFMGGVTDATRLSRRARFLANVLANGDFRVEVRGDLVVARLKKLTENVMKSKLYLLGVLVAYSRQLDVQMGSETHISMYVDQFKNLMQSNLT